MTNKVLKNELQLARWRSKFIGTQAEASEKTQGEERVLKKRQEQKEPAFTL